MGKRIDKEGIAAMVADMFDDDPLECMPRVIRAWQQRTATSLSKADDFEKQWREAVLEGLIAATVSKLVDSDPDFAEALTNDVDEDAASRALAERLGISFDVPETDYAGRTNAENVGDVFGPDLADRPDTFDPAHQTPEQHGRVPDDRGHFLMHELAAAGFPPVPGLRIERGLTRADVPMSLGGPGISPLDKAAAKPVRERESGHFAAPVHAGLHEALLARGAEHTQNSDGRSHYVHRPSGNLVVAHPGGEFDVHSHAGDSSRGGQLLGGGHFDSGGLDAQLDKFGLKD